MPSRNSHVRLSLSPSMLNLMRNSLLPVRSHGEDTGCKNQFLELQDDGKGSISGYGRRDRQELGSGLGLGNGEVKGKVLETLNEEHCLLGHECVGPPTPASLVTQEEASSVGSTSSSVLKPELDGSVIHRESTTAISSSTAPSTSKAKSEDSRATSRAPLVKISDSLRALMRDSLVPSPKASGSPPLSSAIDGKANINTDTDLSPSSDDVDTTPSTPHPSEPFTPTTATTTPSDYAQISGQGTQPAGLLTLPDEVLLQILGPLLTHPYPMPVTPRWEEVWSRTGHVDYSVLHTCTTLYALTLPLYYQLNTFAISLTPFHTSPSTHSYPYWPFSTGQSTAVAHTRSLIISARPYGNWSDAATFLKGFKDGRLGKLGVKRGGGMVVFDMRFEGQVDEDEGWIQGDWKACGWEVCRAGKELKSLVYKILGAEKEERGKGKARALQVMIGDVAGWKKRDEERGRSVEDQLVGMIKEGMKKGGLDGLGGVWRVGGGEDVDGKGGEEDDENESGEDGKEEWI